MQSHRQRSTGLKTDKGHIPALRVEINIPYPAGNRIRTSEVDDKNATDRAMGTNGYTPKDYQIKIQND